MYRRRRWQLLAPLLLLVAPLSGGAFAASNSLPTERAVKAAVATPLLLHPIKVVSTSGDVTNAEALVGVGLSSTTMTMTLGGPAPMIILDYGQDVGGLPVFQVDAAAGIPKLQSIYSESQQYLLPAGDGAPIAANAPADPSRIDTVPVSGPGLITNRLVQGGERFEAITLTSPGSITLSSVGIQSTTFVPPNPGSFNSSDPQLNEIWALGAYTLQLDQLPAGSQPPLWTVSSQGIDVQYSPIALYQGGSQWKDYTESFQVQVGANEAAWVVRGAFRLVLDADNDTLNTPNVLRHVAAPGFPSKTTTLPFDLKPGTWHTIKTVAAGTRVSVSIDRTFIASYTVPVSGFYAATQGSVGFFNGNGADAQFRNLSVVATRGQTLYSSPLMDPSVLDIFAAGTNKGPSIVDGAKRDRLIWGGDLSQEGPTIFYSNGASEYVRSSLEVLGNVRHSDGQVASVLTPLLVPGTVSGDNVGGFYSLSYSIYFVNNLYDYYLYTGDQAFVTQEWPAVQGELAYLAAHTDAQHLVETNQQNGFDWALDLQTGAVTEYNVLYYHALRSAAELARALALTSVADGYDAQANIVNTAINSTLFNSTTGVYDVSTNARGTFAQDANALAVLYGVAPQNMAASILQNIATALNTPDGPRAFSNGSGITDLISPYMSGFEAQARFAVGDTTGALSLIRTVWGHMTQGMPFYSGGVFEALARNGAPQASRSLAHGWSSGPTSALSKYMLGVRPVEAGYRTWLIEPQWGNLRWAGGSVPTPHGPIQVRWDKTPYGLSMKLTVPNGTQGTARLAIRGARLVTDNDRPMGVGTDYVDIENLGAGTHSIQVTIGSN